MRNNNNNTERSLCVYEAISSKTKTIHTFKSNEFFHTFLFIIKKKIFFSFILIVKSNFWNGLFLEQSTQFKMMIIIILESFFFKFFLTNDE
jgi:hypothetical protein